MLVAPMSAEPGMATFSARDEFLQVAGALTGKALPVGGTWGNAVGDTDDWTVETTGKTAQRTAVSDTALVGIAGRAVFASTPNLAAVAVQVDCRHSALAAVSSGVVARHTDASNTLLAFATLPVSGKAGVTVRKAVGGVNTTINGGSLPAIGAGALFRVRLLVDATGRYYVWAGLAGGALTAVVAGQDPDLATGGTLDDGKVGIFDGQVNSLACTRSYDSFQAWVPTFDAVLNPSQSAELRWDGMVREDATGTAYGPVSQVIGDLPRLPPTVEGRTTEIFVKASRGDFGALPDNGIDDISVRITYRPCWLTVPGS